jgi:hypothetical protein
MNGKIFAKSFDRIEISDLLRKKLAAVLNELHGAHYSERFWGLIIEEYVKTAVTRKHLLETGDVDENVPFLPINSHSFPDLNTIWLEFAKQTVKALKSQINSTRGMELLELKNQFRIGFPEFYGLEKFSTELGVQLPEIHFHLIRPANLSLRSKLNRIAEGIEDNFLKNSVKQLPKLYVEYFRALLSAIPLTDPGEKVFHVHNIRTFADEFIIAKYTENGAKLIWYQHGSHYGEFQWEYLHHYEHLMADEYRTWGWKLKEKDRPWNAYRLEKFRNEYIAFENTAEYSLLLCYPKMYKTYKEHSVPVTRYLEEHLDFNKFPEVAARPRPLHQKHGHESELSFIGSPHITVGSGLEPMAQMISKSELVVQISVPSTNFLECIYTGHPVTGIINNPDPSDIIRPYYQFFLENGVLHNTPQSLVSFLNNTDLDNWWSELQNEPVYQQFRKTFTGCTDNEAILLENASV